MTTSGLSEQTVKCPICGDPYKVFPYFAGDQSACPECVAKADEKMRKGTPPQQPWGSQ